MSITHTYVSSKSDPVDTTLVGKTKWNDVHVAPPFAYPLAGGRTSVTPPAGTTELDAAHRTLVDLTNLAEAHIVVSVVTPASSNTTLAVQKSTDGSSWSAITDLDVEIDTAGVVRSGAVDISALTLTYLRLVTAGGDNSTAAVLGAVTLVEGEGDLGSAPFDFSSITGLVADWNPDALGLAEADPVGSITDISSNANHFIQTSTKRGLYRVSEINGLDAVELDNSDDAYATTSTVNLSGTDDITIFWVGFFHTSSANDDIIIEMSADFSGQTDSFVLSRTSANKISTGTRNVAYSTFDTTATVTTTPVVVTAQIDRGASTNECTVWIDGTSAGTRPFNSNVSGNFGNRTCYLGGRNATSLYAPMTLGRLLIYNSALGTTDRQTVEAELKALFGTA